MLPGGQLSGETGPDRGVLRETASESFPHCAKPFVNCRSGAMSSDCPCPLLAQSRHRFRRWTCLLSGAKRTSLIRSLMSANDPKRTFRGLLVGFGILFSDKL